MVIIHLIVMHVTTGVACTTYQFVSLRYDNPLWRLYDWVLLALLHGMNGLRIVIDDYVHRPIFLHISCSRLSSVTRK